MNPLSPRITCTAMNLLKRLSLEGSFSLSAISMRSKYFSRFLEYLGGVGVATELLREEVSAKTDPLSPENAIVFAVGPFTAVYPMASKVVAMFKSPHTGNLGESHAGGRAAIALRNAGYGAIVIKGASERPVYVAIHGNKVYFRDASALWGMKSSFTVGRIIREIEPGAGIRTIIRIGRVAYIHSDSGIKFNDHSRLNRQCRM